MTLKPCKNFAVKIYQLGLSTLNKFIKANFRLAICDSQCFIFQMLIAQLLVLLVSSCAFSSSADIDIPEMEKNLELKLVQELKTIQDKIDHIDWFFKVGYHNQEKPIMDDIDEFVSNPINTYAMIKRLSVYWPPLQDHIFNETATGQWDELMNDIKMYHEALGTNDI